MQRKKKKKKKKTEEKKRKNGKDKKKKNIKRYTLSMYSFVSNSFGFPFVRIVTIYTREIHKCSRRRAAKPIFKLKLKLKLSA